MKTCITFFCAIVFLIGCGKSRDAINSFPYSNETIDSISNQIAEINSIFYKLSEKPIPLRLLGYHKNEEGKLFYGQYCLAEDGITFLDSSRCNLNILLDKKEIATLHSAIDYLHSKGISGCTYNGAVYDFVYGIGYDVYDPHFDRYLCYKESDGDSIIDVSYLKIYDNKDGLYLIGEEFH